MLFFIFPSSSRLLIFVPSTHPSASAIMSPPVDGKLGKREGGAARILGSGASGVAELMVFHPVVSFEEKRRRDRAD